PRSARAGHGRRVGDRRRVGVRIVSGAAPRQGAGVRAERMGGRLRPRRAGQHDRDAAVGLARRVLRRGGAGPLHTLDPTQLRRAEGAFWWKTGAPAERGRFGMLFQPNIRSVTIAIALMNSCCLFAWWGLNGWVPAYLRLSEAQGGIGLSSATMSWFVIAMQVGMWFGYVTFGFMADAIGRKRTSVLYIVNAAILPPVSA